MPEAAPAAGGRDPWARMASEPENSYRAFEIYMAQPTGHRTHIHAYREFVGNPDAPRVPEYWRKWAIQYDWEGRIAAWDDYESKVAKAAYIDGVKAAQRKRGIKTYDVFTRLLEMADDHALPALEDLFEKLQTGELPANLAGLNGLMGRTLDLVKAQREFDEMREAHEQDKAEEGAGTALDREIEALLGGKDSGGTPPSN